MLLSVLPVFYIYLSSCVLVSLQPPSPHTLNLSSIPLSNPLSAPPPCVCLNVHLPWAPAPDDLFSSWLQSCCTSSCLLPVFVNFLVLTLRSLSGFLCLLLCGYLRFSLASIKTEKPSSLHTSAFGSSWVMTDIRHRYIRYVSDAVCCNLNYRHAKTWHTIYPSRWFHTERIFFRYCCNVYVIQSWYAS